MSKAVRNKEAEREEQGRPESNPEPKGCGKCMSCRIGFAWFLCERPEQPEAKPAA